MAHTGRIPPDGLTRSAPAAPGASVKKYEASVKPGDRREAGATFDALEVRLMKSRWFSRGLIVSVALVSSVGVAACARPDTPAEESPQDDVTAQAEAPEGQARGPGYRMFRQIDALDLTDDQREDLAEIEAALKADLTGHRATFQKVAATLAHGVETGALDEADTRACQEDLARAAADSRVSIVRTINEVHDVLDADQREDLVTELRARREAMRRGESEGRPREGLAKLAASLGLSDQQKQAIRDGIQEQVDKVLPDRKARREAWDAKMTALGDAFLEDDFDAADFDIGGEADEAIARFTSVAKQAVDFSGGVLDPAQRVVLASLMRDRAAALQQR